MINWKKITVKDLSKINFQAFTSKGYSAMHYIASRCKNKGVLRASLHLGGDINEKDKQGHTPLDHAIATKNKNMIQELLALGATHSIQFNKKKEFENESTNHSTI